MSYDVGVNCHTCGNDLTYGHGNMTSNVARVWDSLGAPLRDFHGRTGMTVLPAVQNAIRRYEDMLPWELEHLESLVRGDGSWGKARDAYEFLIRIRDAICLDPLASVSVSR
jgi:hypothetical protein